MFRRLFGRSPPAVDNNDQDPDPEAMDDDGGQDSHIEMPHGDGDQDSDPEISDNDDDQDSDPETADEDGNQDPDPDPRNPDDSDDDQSNSSDDFDDEDPDGYPDDASCSSGSARGTPPEYNDLEHPLNAPLPIAPWERIQELPEIELPEDFEEETPQDDLSGDEGESLEDILFDATHDLGVDLFGNQTPQDVYSSDEEAPEEDAEQADAAEEDSAEEGPTEEDPPQEEPSGVEIISLHSSDDDNDDESIRDAPEPPPNNLHPGTPPLQCDWIPPVNGNYPGPGAQGVRCQIFNTQQLPVHPCDRGNHPLHANGGIRNICDLHRAKSNVSYTQQSCRDIPCWQV